MSLTERAYMQRKWRGMVILPYLLAGKKTEAEKYLSSADYHPNERLADLLEISIITSENIQSFPLEMEEREFARLRYELHDLAEMLKEASNRIDRLSLDIEHQTNEWQRRCVIAEEKPNG